MLVIIPVFDMYKQNERCQDPSGRGLVGWELKSSWNLYVCTDVCICRHLYKYIIYTVCVRMYMYIYVNLLISRFTYMSVYVCIYIYIYIYVCIYLPNNKRCVIAEQIKEASSNQKVMISSLMKEVSPASPRICMGKVSLTIYGLVEILSSASGKDPRQFWMKQRHLYVFLVN